MYFNYIDAVQYYKVYNKYLFTIEYTIYKKNRITQKYTLNGKNHNTRGPAIIQLYNKGTVLSMTYIINGKFKDGYYGIRSSIHGIHRLLYSKNNSYHYSIFFKSDGTKEYHHNSINGCKCKVDRNIMIKLDFPSASQRVLPNRMDGVVVQEYLNNIIFKK
jgi:hypothetical protein